MAMFPYGGRMRNPKTITCDCGSSVECTDSLTNQCDDCGQYFNGLGQKILPPDQWEEPWED